jgi:hypothetical protein
VKKIIIDFANCETFVNNNNNKIGCVGAKTVDYGLFGWHITVSQDYCNIFVVVVVVFF